MSPEILNPAWGFLVTSFISLFVIIDPPGVIVPYLTLSAGSSPAAARALAWRSCLYSFLILAAFVLVGRYIIRFFGISLEAFQIAGGLILFRIAFDMLEGRGHFTRLDTSTSLVAEDYQDIALVPLAMPLLSGPGAITTALVLVSRARSALDTLLVLVSAFLILLVTYLSFRFAGTLVKLIGKSGMRLLTRLMGLVLAAMAVQFVLQGILTAFPKIGP